MLVGQSHCSMQSAMYTCLSMTFAYMFNPILLQSDVTIEPLSPLAQFLEELQRENVIPFCRLILTFVPCTRWHEQL